MISKRDVIVFLAGIEAFHALNHLYLAMFGISAFPIVTSWFTLTKNLNSIAFLINAVLTGLLIWWASKVKYPRRR